MANVFTTDVYFFGTGNKFQKKQLTALSSARVRSISAIPANAQPDPAVFVYSSINYADGTDATLYSAETVSQLTTKLNS